jgi:hypothetical protein
VTLKKTRDSAINPAVRRRKTRTSCQGTFRDKGRGFWISLNSHPP